MLFRSSVARGDGVIMNSSMLIEQALANHANSSNPMCAALKTIPAGWNISSSQNSQLWDDVRKQRLNYSLASNDIKRLRAERDQLRAKLETLTKGKEVSDDKNLNASTSASSGPGRSSDEANRDASNDVCMKPSESGSSSQARPTRHQSEGTPVCTLSQRFI